MERAKQLISKLSFEECIDAYNQMPKGNKIIDLLFDRMEELDKERFDKWLDS